MASQIYSQREILLQNGKEVIVRPLPIGQLRRFMKAWEEFSKLKDEDDGFDVFINCAGISLESNFKGEFESLRASAEEKAEGEFLSKEYKEYLEETLDIDTIYEVLDIAGGLKLNDPKLLEAAAALAAANQE